MTLSMTTLCHYAERSCTVSHFIYCYAMMSVVVAECRYAEYRGASSMPFGRQTFGQQIFGRYGD